MDETCDRCGPAVRAAYLTVRTGHLAAQLTPRGGALPTVASGTAVFGGGLYWLSRLSEHGSYLRTILGPTLVLGAGLGLLFVPLTMIAIVKVAEAESGVASSLRNTGQQVGRSIGLAVLAAVAFSAAAHSARAAATTIRARKTDLANVNPI